MYYVILCIGSFSIFFPMMYDHGKGATSYG